MNVTVKVEQGTYVLEAGGSRYSYDTWEVAKEALRSFLQKAEPWTPKFPIAGKVIEVMDMRADSGTQYVLSAIAELQSWAQRYKG